MSKRRKPILIIVIAAAALLGGLASLITNRSASFRPPAVPNPVMPHPNAFDYYKAAFAAGHETDAVSDSWYPTPGTAPPPYTPSYTIADEASVAKKNLRAIKLVRQGFAYPYISPPIRSVTTDVSYSATFRSLARMIGQEARYARHTGRYDDALTYAVDDCQLGSSLSHRSSLLGCLVGYACQSVGRRQVRNIASQVDQKTARAQAARLLRITQFEEPPAEAVQEEQWTEIASLEDMFKDPNWRDGLMPDDESSGGGALDWVRITWSKFTFRMISPQEVLRDTCACMNDEIRIQKMTYPKSLLAKQPVPGDRIAAQLLMLDYRIFRFKREAAVAANELLATQLALHAYHLGHGRYPATLAQLVPVDLPSVPVDPFSDGDSLRYRLTKSGYLLYSIGPDAKDDGGKPIYDASVTGASRWDVREYTETGDIVAGVNH